MNVELENRIRRTLRAVAGAPAPRPDIEHPSSTVAAARAMGRSTRLAYFAVAASLFAVVVGGAVLLARHQRPATPASTTEQFEITSVDTAVRPGAELVVTGRGCPPRGSLDTSDDPLFLRLTPPTGGNHLGPLVADGRVDVFTTQMYVAGEADTRMVPAEDGTFHAVIPVPVDAVPGSGYTVHAICTTLIRAGDGPDGMDPSSKEASITSAGGITVESTSR